MLRTINLLYLTLEFSVKSEVPVYGNLSTDSLVKDNGFVELIKQCYPVIREKYLDLKDDRLKKELIKMEIRSITISYTKHKGKQSCRIRVTELQNRFEALEIMITAIMKSN